MSTRSHIVERVQRATVPTWRVVNHAGRVIALTYTERDAEGIRDFLDRGSAPARIEVTEAMRDAGADALIDYDERVGKYGDYNRKEAAEFCIEAALEAMRGEA